MLRLVEMMTNGETSTFEKSKFTPKPTYKSLNDEMDKRARQGSITAKNWLEAKRLNAEAMLLINEQKLPEAVALLRQSYRMNSGLTAAKPAAEKISAVLTKLTTDGNNNADALFCQSFMPGGYTTPSRGIEHCRKCLRLFPDDAEFVHALGAWHGFAGDYENGYKYTKRSLELAPNRVDWYYQLASSLRLSTGDGEKGGRRPEIIDLYHKHIDLNPVDERNVPNAYYYLAMMHAYSDEMDLAEKFYKKGLEAEAIRLPCYEEIPEDYDPKMATRLLVSAARSGKKKGQMPSDANNNQAAERVSCDHCGKKVGVYKFECEKCKEKFYCSENCRKKNSKKHQCANQ
jgi:tetratricopeptide (TPR) repeat protein